MVEVVDRRCPLITFPVSKRNGSVIGTTIKPSVHSTSFPTNRSSTPSTCFPTLQAQVSMWATLKAIPLRTSSADIAECSAIMSSTPWAGTPSDCLPNNMQKPPVLMKPLAKYDYVQRVAEKVRREIKRPDDKSIEIKDLLDLFTKLHAVIIPVFWGDTEHHGNALHVYLPDATEAFF